ncbi:MAG: SDR family oxidoreductase [Candidatus Acididesulfobacter diazotrophicus]|jgi:NAD(P)-dependent dehydrogenase (short-subunit alcohol dehydrogenase family)|uniref:SDR family oxidoreductase n=1 Tax=Candidatus Acididesulfobacter diazotrophicus TaxID=2597226 RepID=A0A519BP09_9DELT|nr:MAG: SDR family oxidoreductase [Candidatus Acididesulfobacter diazotrophicus]
MNNTFYGKKILIAGGSSGIGLAVAKQAQTNGACVVVASRNAEANAGVIFKTIGESIELHSFDITIQSDRRRLLEFAGCIDHLVITVRPDMKSLLFQEVEITRAISAFNTKFWGQYGLIQQAQHFINDNGSIILTSGIAGEKIYKGFSTMAIINSATETLCMSLAVELAPLRVNVVSPGFVEPKPKEIREYACQFPLRKLASLDDVAKAYIDIMASPYQTGTITVIDGGARLI